MTICLLPNIIVFVINFNQFKGIFMRKNWILQCLKKVLQSPFCKLFNPDLAGGSFTRSCWFSLNNSETVNTITLASSTIQ